MNTKEYDNQEKTDIIHNTFMYYMVQFLNKFNCLRFKWKPKKDSYTTNEYNITEMS